MRELLGLDIAIHSGAERPLVAEPRHAGFVHGASGLDGADLPAPTRDVDGTDAIRFIIDTCRANEGAWLVAIGPLTNIALALRTAPDLHRPHRRHLADGRRDVRQPRRPSPSSTSGPIRRRRRWCSTPACRW